MQITKIVFYSANRCKFHNGNRIEWGPIRSVIIRVIRELKHATFLSHGRQQEVNISHARTVVSLRFLN